ncbi:MAG: SpvB/TcaC N-terminal domain-containing protein, partial [Patescibacteria group bacterium]
MRIVSFALLIFFALPITLYAAFGDGAPTIFNPDVFTDTSSQLRVDGSTGAFTQRVSIAIPPGRSSLQPDLALDYNSQRAEDSIVGYGWSLSIPYIQRFAPTGSQDLYSGNARFISSMDGELVAVTAPTVTHRARVDTGAYNAYTYLNNTWVVYDKKGTKYTFGSADSGRQYDTATTSTRTYKWTLQEIRDTNNNYITYTYSKSGNEIYPATVTYTGNNVTEGPFTVNFATSTRPDVRESYKPGFKVTTNYRISEITASISGSVVNRYTLAYGTGSNNKRSLLTSVQRQGYAEDASSVTLPAMTFTYASSSSMFYAPSGGGYQLQQAYLAADANGNGILDVNYFNNNNNGTGNHGEIYADQATSVQNLVPPEFWGYFGTPQERGTRFLDVNGDGKADIVRGLKDDAQSTTTSSLYTNAGGYSWAASSTFNGVIPAFGYYDPSSYAFTTGIFGEVNGDGLPDYAMHFPNTATETYLGNGSAWTATSTIFAPLYAFPFSAPTERASQLVDVNADGLDDWVYSDGSSTLVRLNNGTGWDAAASSQWTVATSTLYAIGGGYHDRGIRFMDLNGDGLQDYVRSYGAACTQSTLVEATTTQQVLLNTGNGWATSTAYTLPAAVTYAQGSGGTCNGGFSYSEYANWTGNGQMLQDVITSVTSSQGATKTITYTPSAQLGTNPDLPVSLLVVTQIVENDGFSTSGTTSYAYQGGKIYLDGGVADRKFAGFAISTVTAPDAITTTYYNQGDGINTALGEQSDGFGQINRPFRKDVLDLSETLVQRMYYRSDTNTASSSIFVGTGREMTFDYGTGGSHRDRASEYVYATTSRDVISMTEYGQVTGSADGTFSDTGTDKRTAVFAYTASSTAVSLPRTKTLFDNAGATTTDERYYYDGLALGSATKGNRTKVERLKSGSTYVSDQLAFNTYGLVASTTDPRGNITTLTYDARNLYVATSTNPLSHQTQFYYDYTLGKPKQTIDPNTRVFETTYDGLDRPLLEKQPDIASPGSLASKKAYTYTDTVGSRKVVETNYLDSSTDFIVHTYLDGLDKVLQTRKEAEATDEFVVRDFAYNPTTGLLKQESLPYFGTGSARASATTNLPYLARYTYDPLKRILTLANAVGTTTSSYNQATTTITDVLGNSKDFGYDAYGRLSEVIEREDSNSYTTKYQYDAPGNLTRVTDADQSIRNFTYDSLGRRLTAQDLHDAGDGTFGTWTYVYDTASNLASTTDPKGQLVNYSYDSLNRVLTEDYTGLAGTEVQYAYDTCAEGKPRLCTATSTGAVTKFTYNALGLPATESKAIGIASYVTSYSYNRLGGLAGIVYPDSSEVQYTYNTAGLLESVAQKESGGAFADVVNGIQYAPTEKATFKNFANGVQSTYTFDANELYRLRSIVTGVPQGEGLMGGGGELGFANNPWQSLALALEELPWALLDGLDLPEEIVDALEPEAATTTEPVVEEVVEEVATTTEPLPEPEIATTTEPILEEVLMEEATSTEPTIVEELVFDEISTTTPETILEEVLKPVSIRALLTDKSSAEKATIKGAEIAKVGQIARTVRANHDLEVVSLEPIEGGVQVFARAWSKEGEQIGFGADGTVDIERFRIYNPPILVPDEAGDIVQTYVDFDGKEHARTLREDPEEALLQVIEQALPTMKNKHSAERIEKDKQGNTTSIFYPDPSPEVSSVDGYLGYNETSCATGVAFSTAQSAADATGGSDTTVSAAAIRLERCGGGNGGSASTFRTLFKAYFLFDTAPIVSGSTIDSATLSLYGIDVGALSSGWLTAAERSFYIASSSPASNTAVTNADWDQVGTTTAFYTNDFGDAGGSWNISGYNDMALNASGKAAINESGVTTLATMTGAQFLNDEPAATAGAIYQLTSYQADETGTTQDPKLTVETSAGGGGGSPDLQNLTYTYDAVGNITLLQDASDTDTIHTTVFGYDDLYRLTTASTTAASSTPFSHVYTYDKLGKLTSKTGSGSYTYAETGYAN